LHSGFTRIQALIFNVLSGFATLVGALIAYYGLQDMHHLLPYALAIAASSFIYVAVADLIPGLHRRMELAATLQQIVLMSAGVLTIYIADSALH
jgi:zinc and cadmium transporter